MRQLQAVALQRGSVLPPRGRARRAARRQHGPEADAARVDRPVGRMARRNPARTEATAGRLRLRHRRPRLRRPLLLVLRRHARELVRRDVPPARCPRSRAPRRARSHARLGLRHRDPRAAAGGARGRRGMHGSRPRRPRPRVRSDVPRVCRQRDHADGLAVRVSRARPGAEPAARMSVAPARRPRLLVLNQYYWPGIEATAHLLSELCAALATDFDVTVVTGRLPTPDGRPGRTMHEGVEVRRVRSTAYDRSRLHLRATNYATYLFESLREGLAAESPDVVLCMTDPPVIADVALLVARRFGVPLAVVSQDVFPEVAIELKRLENPVVIGLLRAAIRAYLQQADRVVAIGETMRLRL